MSSLTSSEHAAVATPVLPKIIPKSPSSSFVRNLSAEEDAYAYGVAQGICARIVSQRPPRVESISAVSSSDTNNDDTKVDAVPASIFLTFALPSSLFKLLLLALSPSLSLALALSRSRWLSLALS